MANVNPNMISLARESRGYSQNALAKKLSVSPSKLSKLEAGLLQTSDNFLDKLSDQLGYPKEFFTINEELYGLGLSGMGIIHYRRRKAMPMSALNTIQAQMNIKRIHVSRLLKSVEIDNKRDMPCIDIDDLDGSYSDAFEVARITRATWRLPNGPINNLTEIIESAGGIIIPCDFGSDKIDALSQPGSPPIFLINSNSPGDRLRFSLAHELGHIIMHRVASPNMEKEANQFAAEFLMPEHEIREDLRSVSIQRLANLKPYWKVSMAALLHRAHEINLVTMRTYQYLWTQMAPFRKREPAELDIPFEQPQLLNNILNTYKKELNYSAAEISKMLLLFENEAMELYMRKTDKSHLRIVKG